MRAFIIFRSLVESVIFFGLLAFEPLDVLNLGHPFGRLQWLEYFVHEFQSSWWVLFQFAFRMGYGTVKKIGVGYLLSLPQEF